MKLQIQKGFKICQKQSVDFLNGDENWTKRLIAIVFLDFSVI